MTNNRRKPLIGVTGPDRRDKFLWWCTRFGVWLAGGKALRLTPSRHRHLQHFHGFIIAGGGDINPERYGEAAVAREKQYDTARDDMEQEVIDYAVNHNKPILGICRGMQMMNVALGGSLYQEAGEVLEDFLPSRNLFSKLVGRRDVQIDPDSQLYRILGEYEHYNVNSIHHQAVNRLGNDFRVVAREENGLVQAIEPTQPNDHPLMLGVQWHPELMLHANSARNLFRALVRAAKGQNPVTG